MAARVSISPDRSKHSGRPVVEQVRAFPEDRLGDSELGGLAGGNKQ
jgi:hypothetical protein